MDFSTGLSFCDFFGLRFLDLIFHAITPAFHDHGFGVVQETVQHGACQVLSLLKIFGQCL